MLRLGGSRVAPLGANSSSSTLAAYGHDDLEFPRLLTWQSCDSCFCQGYVCCVRLDPSCQKFYFFRRDGGGNQWQPPWLPWGGCRPRPLCLQFRLRVHTLRARWLLGLFYSWSSARCSHLATGHNFCVTPSSGCLASVHGGVWNTFSFSSSWWPVLLALGARDIFRQVPRPGSSVSLQCGFGENFSHFLRWYVSGLRRMQKYAQLILQLPCLHAVFALGTWTSLLQAARARQ